MLLTQIRRSLGLPDRVIQAIARKASHAYKSYLIPKRGGGFREVHHPSKQLKALQRWLLQNIIAHWPVHDAASAYRANRSIVNNAQPHVNSRYLLRMDFQDFFPSITSKDITTYLKRSEFYATEKWTVDDVELFIALVSRNGCLTIGAPTSPALSNAVCFDLDHQVDTAARAHDVIYTRYADDLFFSSVRPNILKDLPVMIQGILDKLDCPSDLRINESKTRHSSKRGRRAVTGLVLRSDQVVGIGRKRKRYIRGLVHRFDLLPPVEKRHLAGLIAFARNVEPDFINSLILKFGPERINLAQQMF